ncbi:tetratricopeptide repeat protein [Sphingobium sp. HWE2-09]|uniref:tetratricopeptide repeat protein n=1 Tax=Sphingobium sp. HWE2-09 TaxID=3108390 RepID=UPI002DC90D7A|nr:SPOR domain-containing protein [Sphingobium sp. HWE2-09]
MGAAQAQYDQSQLVRPLGAADLNSNLARLASDPRDVNALIGAGEAALSLDDARAAAGFFARADAIASGNGRIKAGLGRVMLKLQNPAEALRLFDQAARLGYPDATILSDRGLARDMTGDQAGAQRDYQAALQRTPNDDELVRRYAASLGIAGQIAASDKVMEPLFYKSDRAAWRYRAFILAMNNKQAEAKKVAEQTMPAQLAAAITPYMQKMPYLTAAQKAAAVHFGHFPAQIGTTIAAVTPTPPAPGVAVASAAPATVASAALARTKPLSRSEQRRQQREAARAARAERLAAARRPAQSQSAPVRTATAQPTPTQPAPVQMAQATPPQAAIVQPTPRPTVAQPSRQPQSQPTPQPTPQPRQTPPAAQVQPLPAAPSAPTAAPQSQPAAPSTTAPSTAVQGPPAPGFESIDRTPPSTPSSGAGSPPNGIALAQSTTPAATTTQPLPSAPPQPDPAATRSLADIIRAIDVPDTERQPTVAAVDLSEIAAIQATRRVERQTAAKAAADKAKKDALAKAKVEADAKAKKEAEEKKRLADNPSRNWLQIGVGQSKSALGFTMKGLRKKYTILSRQDGWSASWGRTNRLLVGPFASFTRAKELETSLKKDGADAFAWKSGAGEVVEKLGD